MTDSIGKEINVGDNVVVNKPYSHLLAEGTIIRITPLGATVKLTLNNGWELARLSQQIIKV